MAYRPLFVFQWGELAVNGYHVERHEQFVHEITFVLSGRGIFIIDGRQYDVTKGDLIINRIGGPRDTVIQEDRSDLLT